MKTIHPLAAPTSTPLAALRFLTLMTGLVLALHPGVSAQDATPPAAKPADAAPAKPPTPLSESEKGIRFNFRGVPLEMVLNYLSEAAGFIIVLDTRVDGKVDAWSNQPLTKDEAVELLNTVLAKNGYTAIRNGRTLRIVSRDDAKSKDIPVRAGNDPDKIQKSDEMVTQVIPVLYANAPQLVQNLTQLLPTYATLTANESGNALVLTGTQTDVRRMVEIVKALDNPINNNSSLKVFALRFADAKTLADAVKELFTPPQQNNNDRRNQFRNRFFEGGGPGGPGGAAVNTQPSLTQTANSRIIAVADERANALIVSGPAEFMPEIETLVKELDVSVADVTELRVFRLNNASPDEMATLLSELFPDETRTGNNQQQQQFRFGGGPFGGNFGGGRNRNNQANTSDRLKKMGRVVAVPDQRTSSIIVSAAGDLMPQISDMIEQLDASPAKKQKVFVYSLENADVGQVEQIVRDMFDRSNMSGNRNNANQNSALQNRSQQNQQTVPGGGGANNGGFGNRGGQGGNQGLP